MKRSRENIALPLFSTRPPRRREIRKRNQANETKWEQVEEDETGRSFDAASSPALTHAIHSSFAMEERTQEGSREGDQKRNAQTRSEEDENAARRYASVPRDTPFLYASYFLRLNAKKKKKTMGRKKMKIFKEARRAGRGCHRRRDFRDGSRWFFFSFSRSRDSPGVIGNTLLSSSRPVPASVSFLVAGGPTGRGDVHISHRTHTHTHKSHEYIHIHTTCTYAHTCIEYRHSRALFLR